MATQIKLHDPTTKPNLYGVRCTKIYSMHNVYGKYNVFAWRCFDTTTHKQQKPVVIIGRYLMVPYKFTMLCKFMVYSGGILDKSYTLPIPVRCIRYNINKSTITEHKATIRATAAGSPHDICSQCLRRSVLPCRAQANEGRPVLLPPGHTSARSTPE